MVKSIKKYKFIHNTIIKIMRKFYGGCKMNKWICPTCGYIMDKESVMKDIKEFVESVVKL